MRITASIIIGLAFFANVSAQTPTPSPTPDTWSSDPVWWRQDNTGLGYSPVVTSVAVIPQPTLADQNPNRAPVTLGQLKYFAFQAKARLDWVYSNDGGAGTQIDNLIASFGQFPLTQAQKFENFVIANIGQLKHVASIFYARLREKGYNLKLAFTSKGLPANWASDVPWDVSTPLEQNHAPANLGQLKMCFSFDPEDESHIYVGTRKIIYVDASRPDNNGTGTKTSAFKTITKALEFAQPGDKIKIASGIYRETVVPIRSGSPSLPIVIEGSGNTVICGTDWISDGWQFVEGTSGVIQLPGNPTVTVWNGNIFRTSDYYFNNNEQIDFFGGNEIFSHGMKGTQGNEIREQRDSTGSIISLGDNYLRYQELVSVSHASEVDNPAFPAGRMLLRRTSLAALRAMVWSFYIDVNRNLYVHFPANFHPEGWVNPNLSPSVALHIEANGVKKGPNGQPLEASIRPRITLLNAPELVSCITVRNIRFTNGAFAANGGAVIFQGSADPNSGVLTGRATHWTFENCVFEGANSNGVAGGIVSDITFRGCAFNRNGQGGIAISNFNNLTIKDCEMNYNGWKGFGELNGNSNKIFGGSKDFNRAIGVTFDNCVAAFNIGSGIWFDSGIWDINVKNSEFFGNYSCFGEDNGNGVVVEISGGPVKLKNNLIYSNCYKGFYNCESGLFHANTTDNPATETFQFIFEQNKYADQFENYARRTIPRRNVSDPSDPGNYYSALPASQYIHISEHAGSARGTTGGNAAFSRITVPSHPLFGAMFSEELSEQWVKSGPTLPYSVHVPPSTATGIVKQIPVYSRGPVINTSAGGANMWECVIYDCYENTLTLTTSDPRGLKLLNMLPIVPLTRPIFLFVTKIDQPQTVSLTPNENQPAIPRPSPPPTPIPVS